MAVILVLPSVAAFNCSELEDEEYKICRYIEDTDWPQAEKDEAIQDAINSKTSLDGDFDSIKNKPIEEIQLNKLEVRPKVSDENKKFLIDFSSISIFGYIVYAFLKKYYLLLNFL